MCIFDLHVAFNAAETVLVEFKRNSKVMQMQNGFLLKISTDHLDKCLWSKPQYDNKVGVAHNSRTKSDV